MKRSFAQLRLAYLARLIGILPSPTPLWSKFQSGAPILMASAIVVSIMGIPGVSFARDDAEASRTHYEAGVRHFDVSEYKEALDKFKEAYRNKPDPVFLYNIAQCHRKLGHTDEAIDLYLSYLRRAPEAANREEVERRIRELRALSRVAPAASSTPSPSSATEQQKAQPGQMDAAAIPPVAGGAGAKESVAFTPSPITPVPSRAHLATFVGTDFPVDVSFGVASELGGRFRLSSSLGFLPSPYARAMNGAMVSLNVYDQNTADLIQDTLKSSLVWRTHMGVFPFQSSGLYLDVGYGMVTLGGGATAGEILGTATGLSLPSNGPFTARDFDVSATLHMIDVEIGWRINIGGNFELRPSIGGAFTVANNTSVVSKSSVVPTTLTAPFCARAADNLHGTLATYAHLPVISLHLGYRLF